MGESDELSGASDLWTLPDFPHSAAPANDEVEGDGTVSTIRLSAARRILYGRRIRAQMFEPAMFGEPAWDMLLTLYVHEAAGHRPTRANLAQSAEVPPSAAVRWQDYLERQELIELTHGATDGPLHLRLTPKARDKLNDYLKHVGGA